MTSKIEFIPQDLQIRPQWVVHKASKQPYDAKNGKRASSTNSSTWSSFGVASMASLNGQGYDGIGFVFSEVDPFAGIDLDHCVNDGMVKPWAQQIIDRLDSYTELSPSGTGIHIIIKASVPEGSRNRTGQIEMYSQSRYFTVTGKHLEGTPTTIEERQDELMELHSEIFPEALPISPPLKSAVGGFDGDDDALLEKARSAANGTKFSALFERGDTSGYQSPSEADMALCDLLAFWAGPKADRIDRLFRRSALYRDKWIEREDYRQQTIVKALTDRTDFYQNAGNVIDKPMSPRPDDSKEPGLTKILTDAICKSHHFARDGGGKLYVFEKGFYKPYGEMAIKKTVKHLLEEWKMTAKWSSRRAEETVEYIRIDSPELWDRPPLDTVNLTNGLLDINKRELRKHNPGFLSPVQLPVTYDSDAKCPYWERFISETFPEDAQGLPWELAAWLMLPDTTIQKAVLLLGEGANGKSTFLAALTAFLGKRNTAGMSLHKLESDKFAAARLVGKLANICPDLPSTHLVGTDVFKRITDGTEPITAERKFHDSFDLYSYARLIFSANHPPRSPDASHAFFRRWIVVPFSRTFDPADQVPRNVMDKRLNNSTELSGVLNHALFFLQEIRNRGFTESQSMKDTWNEFRENTDPIVVWLDTHTLEVPDAVVSKKELLQAYNTVARREQRIPMTSMAFGQALKRLRPNIQEGQRSINGIPKTWVWLGLGLKKEILEML